jgi:hypothetical protein
MGTTMNITRTDLTLPLGGARRAPHELTTGELPRALFVAEVLARGLTHVAQDSFQGTVDPARLTELATPILVRANPDAAEIEALLRLPAGQLALVDNNYGHVQVEVAAGTRGAAEAGTGTLREALRAEPPAETRVSMAFWMRGNHGGDVRHRQIDAPAFDEIAGNYAGTVRGALQRLIDLRAPEVGRLILWRGPPGTGKSHALRALTRAWAPWCSAHFIMDPEELLGQGGAYMLDLLSWDGDDEDRWRLLILEDAGELIAADARAATGQALSRLLNVADGLLGQGTRTLLLITTNEPVGRLHPAARRPGRCLADIEFTPLPEPEANSWLAAHGHTRRVDRATPLAELFGGDDSAVVEATGVTPGFGFARALSDAQSPAAPQMPRSG